VVLIFDEVQAGFGRTGKFWAFEHYGVTPDLICCGKGISSSLPLSAVLGREHIMDQYAPGSMTSTHTGNPVCCAAAFRNEMSNGALCADQHAAPGELEERGQRDGDRRRLPHQVVGDPGQHRDERRDRGPGVHQRLQLADDLTAAHRSTRA